MSSTSSASPAPALARKERNASYAEIFDPPFDDETRQGTVTSSIFSLVSTILVSEQWRLSAHFRA
jgi:hypothetical protein